MAGTSFSPPKFTYPGGNVEILDGYYSSGRKAPANVTFTSKWDGADVTNGPTAVEGWVNGKKVTNATPSADLAHSLGVRLNSLETIHSQVNGSVDTEATTNKTATKMSGAVMLKAATGYDWTAS